LQAEPQLLELIAAAHRGALEDHPWRDFVHRLRLALGANSANFILREAGAAPDELFAVVDYRDGTPEQMNERYFEDFHRDDPFPYFEMEPGKVYGEQALFRGDPETSRFFTDYLKPAGIARLLIFHAAEPDGCRAWVTVTRGEADPPFGDDERRVCEMLAEQLGVALQAFATLQMERLRGELYAHAAHRLNVDFLLLDDHGRLMPANDRSADLRLKRSGLRRGADGRLHGTEPAQDAALQKAVAQARAGPGGQVLHLADEPYLDVFITPVDLVQPPHPALGRETPAMVVYLHSGPVQASSRYIKALFGLSGTEARLAEALARGRTLTEAAAEVGVTEQTARRYSKLIFSKTGANRQSELIRKILSSAAALAD
jgi:DNA-binding CsgD family transcriptional regulator